MKYQAKIPTVFTNMLVSKLGEISNKTVLVIRDWYTAVFLAKNNKVLFITDDPEAEEKFRLIVIRNISFGNDDNVILINTTVNKKGNIVTDSNAWLNVLKGIDMKFDVAIMNPPYDGNLHLKILSKVIPICDKVINISPIRWLQDPLGKYRKNSDYIKFEESISKKIESLDIFSQNEIQKIFNALFSQDVAIYVLGNGGFNYSGLVSNIIQKIIKYMIENPAPFESNKQNGFRVRIPELHCGHRGGHVAKTRPIINNVDFLGKLYIFNNGKYNNKWWYECYNRNQHTKTTPYITNSIYFNSETEAKNFIDSTKTKIFKYISYNVIKDINIEPTKVLWLYDYTLPWNDKRLCNFFNINGYISDTEAIPGSEWETILNTMNKSL